LAVEPAHAYLSAPPSPTHPMHPGVHMRPRIALPPLLQLPNKFEQLPFLFRKSILPPSHLPHVPQMTEAELRGEAAADCPCQAGT
jgi:hypothetical protein